MKKIYYLLCLIPLMHLVTTCADEEADVVLFLIVCYQVIDLLFIVCAFS